jgi:hypothetical protein
MVSEDKKSIATCLLGAGVLFFVISMGSCFSCVTADRKVVYDSPEEYYQKSDGSTGYGAKAHTEGGEGYFLLIVGFFVASFVSLGVGGAMLQSSVEPVDKEPEETVAELRKRLGLPERYVEPVDKEPEETVAELRKRLGLE